MPEITVTEYAVNPDGLLEKAANVWLQPTGITGGAGGAVELRIRGEHADVARFIADNWGDEEVREGFPQLAKYLPKERD